MYQRRTSPHKWVVKSVPSRVKGKGRSVSTEYVVVGLNHADYMAQIALRAKNKRIATRTAALLNKRPSD